MYAFLFASSVLTILSSTHGEPCTTPNGGSGDCKSLLDCKPLIEIVNKASRNTLEVEYLKKSQCGFMGNTPLVCCPPEPETIPKVGTSINTCTTPDGHPGTCISIHQCDNLAELLSPPVPQQTIMHVQKSRCNGPDTYSVCCGPKPNLPKEVPGPSSATCQGKATAYPPAPESECCGIDSSVGNKIFGGNATGIEMYPWLVIIEYRKDNVLKTLCGGSLISSRYVLTAGHCVAGSILNAGTPTSIRLGDYDKTHEGPDCIAVEAGGMDCTDEVVRIEIEKTIPHPQYKPAQSQKRNDIALIRLKENAPYTDFIRPICLPTMDLTLVPPVNFSLYAAGWGAVTDEKFSSEVKMHVELPFVGQEQCQPAYKAPGRNVQLWKGQICAGGQKGKDSCKGDSGGPLMYENGRIYEILGVVSFGPVPCGMEDVPGVYTKVFEYLDWIRSNMRP